MTFEVTLFAGDTCGNDAAEAYLPDVPRPIKPMLDNFDKMEELSLKAIFEKFELPWPMPKIYKEADNAWLITEAQQLMESKCLATWKLILDPVDPSKPLEYGTDLSKPWDFATAEARFLEWAAR